MQGGGVIAEDFFRGLFHAAAERVQAVFRLAGGAPGGFVEFGADQFGCEAERLSGFRGFLEFLELAVEVPGHYAVAEEFLAGLFDAGGVGLVELAQGIVERSRDQRFGPLRFIGQAAGAVHQVGGAGALGFQGVEGVLLFRGVAQGRAAWLVRAGAERFGDFLLAAGEVAGFGAQGAQFLGQRAGALSAQLLAHFLELPLGAGAGGEGLGGVALGGGLGGALGVLACLFELLALGGHGRLGFGAVHALAHFVHVGEHLALFLLEPFELASEFLALRLAGRLQGGLHFLEPFVDVFLASGEFLQAVLDLAPGAAFGVLRGGRLAFGFVAVFGLFEVQFLQLVLSLLFSGRRLARRLLAAAVHFCFAFAEFEQRLIGGLFGGQRLGEGGGGGGGGRQRVQRLFHFAGGGSPQCGAHRFFGGPGGFGRLVERLLLRVAHDRGIGSQRGGGRLAALELPRRIDDLFLELGEAGGRAALGLALFGRRRLPAIHAGALPEDFVKRPDLGKKEIALSAPAFAVRTDVVGPHEPGIQVIGLGVQRLQLEQVEKRRFFLRGHVLAERDDFGRLTAAGHAEPVRQHAEIVPGGPFENNFLQGRRAQVAPRRGQFELGRAVRQRLDDKEVRHLVGAAVGIDQLQFV